MNCLITFNHFLPTAVRGRSDLSILAARVWKSCHSPQLYPRVLSRLPLQLLQSSVAALLSLPQTRQVCNCPRGEPPSGHTSSATRCRPFAPFLHLRTGCAVAIRSTQFKKDARFCGVRTPAVNIYSMDKIVAFSTSNRSTLLGRGLGMSGGDSSLGWRSCELLGPKALYVSPYVVSVSSLNSVPSS